MENNYVIILTNKDEVGVDRVVSYLSEFAQNVIRINVSSLLEDKIDLSLNESNMGLKITSRKLDFVVGVCEIKSIWYRRPENPVPTPGQIIGYDDQEIDFLKRECASFFWSLQTVLVGYWMNHPLYGTRALEHNKAYQMSLASKCGLKIPRTIVSNSPDKLVDFSRSCGGIVAIKTIKQRVFKKADDTYDGIYTNKITTDLLIEHREELAVCPVMLQEYIEKSIELRVTIVGNNIFTCAIHSQDSVKTMDDWRKYDFDRVRHEQYDLPKQIEDKLLLFMKVCKLNFGAIDMILTPSGDYYFLEVNPSGQYGWIESLTGMPISKAIAETLTSPNTE